MTRRFWLAAGLAVAAVAGAADAPQQGFVELFKASTEAYQSKDYARMEKLLGEALKQRPGHPTALYNLAAAQALGGDKGDALDTLEGLARMGLSFDPAGDEDFAGLRDKYGFKSLIGDFRRNRKAVGEATTSFKVLDTGFIPEGIAFDEDTKSFFLGSVRERRIQRIGRDGTQTGFVAPGALWAVLGMSAESSRRRLWVATAAIPEMKGASEGELGRSAIVAFDIDSGAQKQRYVLPDDGRKHVLGDVIATKSGKVYTTDSATGQLYSLDTANGKFEALTPPGALSSPQGLALSRDKEYLYVADYTQGLYRFDLDRKELKRLDVARDICVYGIDGLYRYDNDLIAIQNGVRPHRVVRFELERGGRRVRHATVLAANLPDFDEPTLGVLVGKRFHFVANSQWNKFRKDHTLPPDDQLRGPVVLEIRADTRLEEDERRDDRSRGVQQQAPQQSSPLPLPSVPLPRVP